MSKSGNARFAAAAACAVAAAVLLLLPRADAPGGETNNFEGARPRGGETAGAQGVLSPRVAESAPAGASPEASAAESNVIFKVTGRICDINENPVANADVALRRAAWAGFADGGRHFVRVECKTNKNGAFELPCSESGPDGAYLEARADGFAPLYVKGIQSRRGRADVGTLTLLGKVSIAGRVEDDAGRAVAGAKVYYWVFPDITDRDGELALPPAVESDANGRFAVEGLPPAAVDLGIVANGFANITMSIAKDRLAEPIRVALAREAVVEGRVAGDDGLPVANAKISVFDAAARLAPIPSVRSGAEGGFRIQGLPAEPNGYIINIDAFGYVGARWSGGGPPEAGIYALKRAPQIIIKIVAESGAPAAIKSVSREFYDSNRRGWGGIAAALTPDAPAHVRVVAPDRWQIALGSQRTRLLVSAADGASGQTDAFDPTPPGAEPREIVVTVRAARTKGDAVVEGRVADSGGRPLANVNVTLGSVGPRPASVVRKTLTNETGAFYFDRLPNLRFTATALLDGYYGKSAFLNLENESYQFGEIKLLKFSSIRGLVSEDGAPPRGPMRVICMKIAAHTRDRFEGFEVAASDVNKDGAFTIDGLEADHYVLVPIRGARAATGDVVDLAERIYPDFDFKTWQGAVAAAAERESFINLDLRPARIGGIVSIDGAPAAGMNVTIETPARMFWRGATTDARGRFEFAADGEGEYLITVKGPNLFASKNVTISRGARETVDFEERSTDTK